MCERSPNTLHNQNIFDSVSRPFQDYFSSYEMGQSVGGSKTVEPREKPSGTPASRTWLVSHVARAGLEPSKMKCIIIFIRMVLSAKNA